jgi:hypothetical protein
MSLARKRRARRERFIVCLKICSTVLVRSNDDGMMPSILLDCTIVIQYPGSEYYFSDEVANAITI